VPEEAAFTDPVTFSSLFMLAPDPVTGRQRLNFVQQPINIAKANYAGLDLSLTLRSDIGFGKLTTTLGGTHMLTAEYTVPGLDGFQSSLGKFGVNSKVVFRNQFTGSLTLDSGDWSTTLAGHYRSGYVDHEARCADPSLSALDCTAQGLWLGPDVRTVNPATGAFGNRVALRRRVAAYQTFDIQTRYRVTSSLDLTLAVRNVLDQDPPFSIQDAGGGNMRGYDGRYADPLGRHWALKASYRF
jgi:iron complex outermembrane recepter protein